MTAVGPPRRFPNGEGADLLLGLCIVGWAVFLALRASTVVLWVTNSDQLTIPAFVDEMLRDPAQFVGWQLPRAPVLFPDMASYAILRLAGLGSLAAAFLAAIPLVLTWFVVCGVTLRHNPDGGPVAPYTTAAALFVLPLAVMIQISPPLADYLLKFAFSFGNHFSSLVLALAAFWILERYRSSGSRRWLVVGAAAITLGVLSNRIFLIYFLAPYLALVPLRYRLDGRRAALDGGLAVLVAIAALAGLALEPLIPTQPRPGATQSLSAYAIGLIRMGADIGAAAQASAWFALWLALLAVLLVAGAARVVADLRQFERLPLAARQGVWFRVFVMAGIALNAVAVAPLWLNIANGRYLMFLAFGPLLLAAGLLRMRRPMALGAVLAVAFMLLLVSLASLSEVQSGLRLTTKDYAEEQSAAACIRRHGGTAGLASYWTARRITFLTDHELPVHQLTPGRWGNPFFHWGNNILDFAARGKPAVRYNFVITNGLDRSDIEQTFGAPAAEVLCGPYEIRIYANPDELSARLLKGETELLSRILQRDGELTLEGPMVDRMGVDSANEAAQLPAERLPAFFVRENPLFLVRGRYRVEVVLRIDRPCAPVPNGESAGLLEVVGNGGSEVLARTRFDVANSGAREIAVSVDIDRGRERVEARVIAPACVGLHVGTLRLRRVA